MEILKKVYFAFLRDHLTHKSINFIGWLPGYHNFADSLIKDNRATAAFLLQSLREGSFSRHADSILPFSKSGFVFDQSNTSTTDVGDNIVAHSKTPLSGNFNEVPSDQLMYTFDNAIFRTVLQSNSRLSKVMTDEVGHIDDHNRKETISRLSSQSRDSSITDAPGNKSGNFMSEYVDHEHNFYGDLIVVRPDRPPRDASDDLYDGQ